MNKLLDLFFNERVVDNIKKNNPKVEKIDLCTEGQKALKVHFKDSSSLLFLNADEYISVTRFQPFKVNKLQETNIIGFHEILDEADTEIQVKDYTNFILTDTILKKLKNKPCKRVVIKSDMNTIVTIYRENDEMEVINYSMDLPQRICIEQSFLSKSMPLNTRQDLINLMLEAKEV